MVQEDKLANAAGKPLKRKKKRKPSQAAAPAADGAAAQSAPAARDKESKAADVIEDIFGSRPVKAAKKVEPLPPAAAAAEPVPGKRSRKVGVRMRESLAMKLQHTIHQRSPAAQTQQGGPHVFSQHMHRCNACRRMELQRNRSRKRASKAPRTTSLPRDLSKDEGVTAAGVSECSTRMLCSWVFNHPGG